MANDGTVTFADLSGRTILAEAAGGRRIQAATSQGQPSHAVQQRWQTDPDESLYGLGQRQEGKLDIKGFDFDLWQRNTVVYVPLIVSSRGYGVLWDNTSPSKFGDIAPFEPIPGQRLIDMSGQPGGLTAGSFASEAADIEGSTSTTSLVFEPSAGGQAAANVRDTWLAGAHHGGDDRRLSVPDVLERMDEGLAGRQPRDRSLQTELGDRIRPVQGAPRRRPALSDQDHQQLGTTLRITWKTPPAQARTRRCGRKSGDGIDYYFLYGPEIDDVIGGYRTLTGRASMLPDWAFGFWQSKNKYNTQDEILQHARRVPAP